MSTVNKFAIVLFVISLAAQPALGQNDFFVQGDTLELKHLLFLRADERNNLNEVEVISPNLKNLLHEKHRFIEDTLLVALERDTLDQRSPLVKDILLALKDSTTIIAQYYAKEIDSSDDKLIHYAYTSKRYPIDFRGRRNCFQTNWAGYILEDGDSMKVYSDMSTSTIPLMYGCHGDSYKAHRLFRPNRVFLDNNQVIIEGVGHGWDCGYHVVLELTGDGVRMVKEEYDDCDY